MNLGSKCLMFTCNNHFVPSCHEDTDFRVSHWVPPHTHFVLGADCQPPAISYIFCIYIALLASIWNSCGNYVTQATAS